MIYKGVGDMRDELFALGLLTIGLISFEIINLVGIKQTGTTEGLLRYTLLTGLFQIGAYFVFVYGLNRGYVAFSNDIWLLMIAQTAISYGVKIFIRSAMFHQAVGKGNLVGLILTVVAAFIAKFWR